MFLLKVKVELKKKTTTHFKPGSVAPSQKYFTVLRNDHSPILSIHIKYGLAVEKMEQVSRNESF